MLGLGIAGITCCVCVVPAVLALAIGLLDLKAMREGRMDDEGHGLTLAGTIMGGIVTGLAVLVLMLNVLRIIVSL